MTTENTENQENTPVPEEEVPVEPTPTEPEPTPEPEPVPEEDPKDTPKEEPPEDEDPQEPTDLGYTEYDVPELNQITGLLKDAELPAEEAMKIFGDAATTGDVSKIDAAALAEKLGKDKADLVMYLARKYSEDSQAAVQAFKEAAYEQVGGEEVFNAMRTWAQAKEQADAEFAKELADIRSMLDSPNAKVRKAGVAELFSAYKADPKVTLPAKITSGTGAVGTSGVEPLSRMQYADEVLKAQRNGTYDKVQSQLWARRQAGIAKNI